METITFDVLVIVLREHWVQLVTGFLLPLAVGFVTKLHAPPWVKAAANFVLALITGVMEAIVGNGNVVDLEKIITYILTVWVASHLSFKMVWRPAGGGEHDPVSLATPAVGVGTPVAASGARAA